MKNLDTITIDDICIKSRECEKREDKKYCMFGNTTVFEEEEDE